MLAWEGLVLMSATAIAANDAVEEKLDEMGLENTSPQPLPRDLDNATGIDKGPAEEGTRDAANSRKKAVGARKDAAANHLMDE